MTTVARHHAHGHDDGHPTSHDDGARATLGFWIYLMSDCVIFATLFATFGVLANATAGGPSGKGLFELRYALGETLLLLASSLTFGLAMLGMQAHRHAQVIAWLAVTFALGAGFVGMELVEFTKLIGDGAGPHVSAFLSSYFVLVGTHGLHVSCGLLWIAVMMHQVYEFGLTGVTRRRLACLSLFWHFLDLIWICVFTFVYLREFV
ncbi:Cytochrome bo(3) ubiquinol oxidase subunit 3 [Paraburkholderia ultramafica]|uniref:Cytochrome bo(3) ubiquinol oxidase subunit 3 n=1 Tax=Paraburkholderia ultramafica TaxID=1544867 RepID=A0A6S7CVC5_9BURK|nr:cytochrome o ubiquinol oxidase subunit III [Paraburkholderia ultramafica]CAB3788964.1 Cytochrome bo(3) ubiquinol oxidase subunit 3 [Paraburkholderia ultramafica]